MPPSDRPKGPGVYCIVPPASTETDEPHIPRPSKPPDVERIRRDSANFIRRYERSRAPTKPDLPIARTKETT